MATQKKTLNIQIMGIPFDHVEHKCQFAIEGAALDALYDLVRNQSTGWCVERYRNNDDESFIEIDYTV